MRNIIKLIIEFLGTVNDLIIPIWFIALAAVFMLLISWLILSAI